MAAVNLKALVGKLNTTCRRSLEGAAGLCLYFIATNIWSMTERWLFQHLKKNPPASPALVPVVTPSPTSPNKDAAKKPSAIGGFWNSLQEAADHQITTARQLESNRDDSKNKKKKKR